MMSFSPSNLSEFFGTRCHRNKPALQVLQDLESRRIVNGPGPFTKMATPRAVCESVAAKSGLKLKDITAGELAVKLKKGWGGMMTAADYNK